jgi:outer membrane protein assembly factor BamB
VASSAAVDHGSGAIFVQTMIGAVAAVETDGHLRWVADSADPYRTRVVHPPVLTADGHVVTGGAGRIRCHAVDDGRLRWQREIGRCDTFLTYGTGLTTSEVVVLPLGGPRFGFVALYLGNGATRWADPPRTPGPRSSLAAGGSGDAIVVRVGPVVERLTLGDGASRWRTELPGPLSIAPPVVLGGTVVVVTGDAVVHRLDAGTGEVRSRQALGGPGGHGPYRCRGPAVAAAVTATAAEVHVVTTSGHWWRIDPDGDAPQLVGFLPLTVISPPMVAGGRIVVAGADGRVVAMSLDDSGVI